MKYMIVLILFFSIGINADSSRGFQKMKTEKRVALVIGNNKYIDKKKFKNLKNPINDARAIRDKLQILGFKVYYGENLSVRDMSKKLKLFKNKLRDSGVGLFFFAGHGVEYAGNNYLIGKDTKLTDKDEVEYESLGLDKVLSSMQNSGNRLNIVILDACREDPFPSASRSSSGGGLAKVDNAKGMLIAYATRPGDVADDGGDSKHGVFTQQILNHIDTQALPVEQFFKKVTSSVYAVTDEKQRPWTHSDIIGDFFFKLPADGSVKIESKVAEAAVYKVVASQPSRRNKKFIEPEVILIKSGKFTKGYEDDWDNAPEHEVSIKKDFYISKYEITFQEYDKFCEDSGWVNAKDNGWGRANQPVINVSWDDATEYVKWLSKKSRKKYRLPSSSEWEYVAKIGVNSGYGHHEDDLIKHSWHEENANKHPYAVGTKRANKFGIHDIFGNVSEWTSDSFYKYDDTDYMSKNHLDEKVVRGGSWFSSADDLTTYKRVVEHRDAKNNHTGFRVVLEK